MISERHFEDICFFLRYKKQWTITRMSFEIRLSLYSKY